MRLRVCLFLAVAAFVVAIDPAGGRGQDSAPAESNDEETKGTEIGIRFTPEIAAAIATRSISQMKPRYDLDDGQAEEMKEIIQRRLMKFAQENAVLNRDMIELMMATMIENDGRFPKEEAKKFAELAQRFTPKFKELITHTSAEIGMKMNVTQRLKYTADVGIFAAGFVIFENRMKRWEEGKIGDYANPFFDPADKDPSKVESEPRDPNESEEHRKARKEVEAWLGGQMNPDERWQEYLDHTTVYYGFTETQKTSAAAILKECRERAKAIKTPEWQAAVKENRIIRRLTMGTAEEVSGGPWMVAIEEAFERLMKPMRDLNDEFRRRLNDLPDSTQRATAREAVRKTLAKKGVKQLPI
ncbi:MAG TPA: hypothetical protein VJZ71_01545 [Phycisphaerae bacterium]|nr:hypothetical protein [Phycisphaerae bacterium]